MIGLELEFDLDSRVNKLEMEWREAFEAHVAARSKYHTLAADPDADIDTIDQARETLEQSEAAKTQVLAKIDRLEQRFLRRQH